MNFDELPSNPRKTKSIRKLGSVDIAELKSAVLALPEAVWDAENASKPNRFGSLDATRHIVFRFVASFYDWRQTYDRPLWAEWRRLIEPVLAAATAEYGYARGEFPRVMLARMPVTVTSSSTPCSTSCASPSRAPNTLAMIVMMACDSLLFLCTVPDSPACCAMMES